MLELHAYLVPQSSFRSIADMAAGIELMKEVYGSSAKSHLAPMINGLVVFTERPMTEADMDALGVGVWQ